LPSLGANKVRQRQHLAKQLRPTRHPLEREHKARQQHRGEIEEHGPLHRLHLAFGNRREESRLPFARRYMRRHNNRTRRLMLTPLGGLAEFERDPIRARAGEGRGASKVSAASPCSTSRRQREPIQRRDRGEPLRSIARSYNVSPSTISRLAA
jgi:hypothetical protein